MVLREHGNKDRTIDDIVFWCMDCYVEVRPTYTAAIEK